MQGEALRDTQLPSPPLVAPHVEAVHGEDDARTAGRLLQLLHLMLLH